MSAWHRLAGLLVGAAAARAAYSALRRWPPAGAGTWSRSNHRGEQVTLLEGPACAFAAGAGVAVTPGVPRSFRRAAAVASLGAGALGGYDDLAGDADSRGLAGHLGALARGDVTSGTVKLLGIGATGVVAAALVPSGSRGASRAADAMDTAVTGAAVAASANLLNLFDLRPGRALKVGVLAGVPLMVLSRPGGPVAAAPVGAVAALLPEDLDERAMLGDAGANALGAALGVAAVTGLGRGGRLALLAGLITLTAASEIVSFTTVIDTTGPLRRLDQWGRRRAADGAGGRRPHALW